MKKKISDKKLKAYSALAASFLGVVNVGESAIVFHDVNPDFTGTTTGTQTYAVDMDNDGTTDFTLSATTGSGTYGGFAFTGTAVAIEMANSNNNVLSKSKTIFTTTVDYAAALSLNDNISSAATTWYSTSNSTKGLPLAATGTVSSLPVSIGQFANTTNKYIGVRFKSGANTYYGWIRVDVTGYNSFTVKDWAYENITDQAILAGAGIPTGVNSSVDLVSTIKNINNTIEGELTASLQGTVQIVNGSGVVVRSRDFNDNSFTLNLQGMPAGIYNVVVSAKEGFYTKKVFIE